MSAANKIPKMLLLMFENVLQTSPSGPYEAPKALAYICWSIDVIGLLGLRRRPSALHERMIRSLFV